MSSTHGSFSGSRVSHACDRCRLMRTKCSGGERCAKCIKDDASCRYGDRKRERNKKDLVDSLERIDILEGENQHLVSALRSLAANPSFDSAQQADIQAILAKYPAMEQLDNVTESSSHQSRREMDLDSSKSSTKRSRPQGSQHPARKDAKGGFGEVNVASSVGSPGAQGELVQVVDLDGGKGASGLIGKMSEMSWIQRMHGHIHGIPQEQTSEIARAEIDHRLSSIKDFVYFMDDTDLLAVDEDAVDECYLPPVHAATVLAGAYFHAVQGAFHFTMQETFLQNLVAFPRHKRQPSWKERRWLALANIVWAVGAKWVEMAQLNPPEQTDPHPVYYARARALGLDHRVMADHPDVERVQGIGILSLYLLTNGSVTRAWNTLGHGIRHATALGLHLKVTDHKTAKFERERRARTWYSLYSLEVMIAEIIGRPKSIQFTDITVPFDEIDTSGSEHVGDDDDDEDVGVSTLAWRRVWLDYLQSRQFHSRSMTSGVLPWHSFSSLGQSPPPSYFPLRLSLSFLSERIGARLYRGSSDDTWSELQFKIGELQSELTSWSENLPAEVSLQSDATTSYDPRAKVELAMYYHSVQMILHRPCLCEIVIENESERSQEFNRSCARACVHAAMSMLAMLPDNPSPHEIYLLLPYWALLHYVAQATAVLLLELSMDCQHFPNELPELMVYLRKAMVYLWVQAGTSLSAYRAWRTFRPLLTEVAARYEDLPIGDIPEQASQPSHWTEDEESKLYTMKDDW